MREILSCRKNRGNVTFRITLSENFDGVLVHIEKFMKVRSGEPGKKTTKRLVYEHTFDAKKMDIMKAIIADGEMTDFCLETLEKIKDGY
ncbi:MULTISPECIES: hypothetical protein [Enterobacterales]|jgi:hypothetical protein|uniref:Uncharacterized protein n=2 Tax=Pantoea brenneri TaxID=472694 RepID=A0A7Y6TUK3_9GAMM|nr:MULTISPECIES: hypothetical protein [Enterobacterales]ELL8673093.1 hypothetical protein [Escherichia coli]HBM7350852.1 hypothetical protein [Klebsiella oxytoca]MBA7950939.1 hypothetical protein [Citrobacter freundii]MBB9297606.1 hypothetical protein [Escherichia coli]MBZ6398021.1 hypothetical protein [Pantoea sp.]